ncbi:MAG: hypothetical protein JJ863_38565 [Deltaproteobacteria bacterium]|nr:hypothetical protein [Deltaproteobacteria bacterium]
MEYPAAKSGKLAASGTLTMGDGTELDWYFWEGDRPMVHSYAQRSGYIAALYDNELYDPQTKAAHFRRFGIVDRSIRENVTLIVRPPSLADGVGVYPDTARASLKVMGSKDAGGPLPWAEWGEEFAHEMPEALRKAIIAATSGSSGSLSDPQWRERLKDRFGKRWKSTRYVVDPKGVDTTDPDEAGSEPKEPTTERPGTGEPGGTGGRGGGERKGTKPKGSRPAQKKKTAAGLPDYRWVPADDLGEVAAAVWQPNDPSHPNGVVLMNAEFPGFVEVVQYWTSRYPDVHAEKVRETIHETYGQAMIARIAHSEALRGRPEWASQLDQLRSPEALTMAALGLFSEDSLIATRLGGLLGKRSKVA